MTHNEPGVMAPAPVVRRRHLPELHTCIVERSSLRELHLTLLPQPGESAAMMLERLAVLLKTHNAKVVRHEVFGAITAERGFAEALQRLFGEQAWPVTWVEGAACDDTSVAGMHVLTIVGSPVSSVAVAGRLAGSRQRG